MTTVLEYALKYAALGWQVLPILPRQKIPASPHGVLDATTDPQQIKEWFEGGPQLNVAVACGPESGVFVVDVDVTEDGSVNGYDSLSKLPGLLPVTVFQHTPRGGCHAFFQTNNPPANSIGLRPGIDIRSTKTYVLLPPSIHPNGKEYIWEEGHEPWNMQLAKYPDFLRPIKKTASAPNSTTPSPVPTSVDNSYALQRARRYLTEVDPAVQGLGGHDKLFWACGCMTWGCELSADQTYDILAREYNPRCVPPWDLSDKKDEKDFRRKITESIKHPPDRPRGWILNDPAYTPIDTEIRDDVRAYAAKAHAPSLSRPPLHENDLKFITQPTGLFGELCSWINATAFKPQPYLTLGCALAFLGVLFGRKVKDTLGSRTNLYVMSVAPSSAGKNHAMNRIRELCLAAGCVDLLAGSNIASDSAVESCVARKPASLFLIDEIGHLLVSIKSGASKHQAQLVSILMQLYSAAGSVFLGREYANVDDQRTIVQPCLCIYGVTTPKKFASGLSASELDDGWLSRCLVFYVEDEPRKLRDTDLTAPPPQHLVELVGAWAKRTIATSTDDIEINQFVVGSAGNFIEAPPEQIIVPTNADAERRCRDFDDMAELLSKKDPRLSASWLKAEENARRIALIVACSDSYDAPVVNIQAADWACRLTEKIVTDFGVYVVPEIADGRMEAEKQKLVNVIKGFGKKGCMKRDITRKTRWASGRHRSDLLTDLIEGGDLVIRTTPTGRGARYWTAEHAPPEEPRVDSE